MRLPESYSMAVSPNEEHACKLLGKGNTDHIPLKTGLNCFFFSTGWNWNSFKNQFTVQNCAICAKNNQFKQEIEWEPNQTRGVPANKKLYAGTLSEFRQIRSYLPEGFRQIKIPILTSCSKIMLWQGKLALMDSNISDEMGMWLINFEYRCFPVYKKGPFFISLYDKEING